MSLRWIDYGRFFEKKEPGECKKLQRKGLELEARESESTEWQNMGETAALAARKEETSVENEKKKYFSFGHFLLEETGSLLWGRSQKKEGMICQSQIQ